MEYNVETSTTSIINIAMLKKTNIVVLRDCLPVQSTICKNSHNRVRNVAHIHIHRNLVIVLHA